MLTTVRQASVLRNLLLFCFLLMAFSARSQVNLTSGLVAYYPFNGNANDASGNGNNGQVQNGVQLATDRFGNANSAYNFDGIDDYITIPHSAGFTPASGFSVALYFYSTQTTGFQTMVGKINYTQGNGLQFQVGLGYSAQPGVFFGLNPPTTNCADLISVNNSYVSTGTYTPNQWNCLVSTFDNGVQKIFLNGVLIQTLNASFNTLNQCSNSNVQIGSWWTLDPQRFKGLLDDVRFYNRALNDSEISALCGLSTCSNWLNTPSDPSFVRVGDLDIPGNQVTIEAVFNRTAPWTGVDLWQGDLVSKHSGPADCNYLLRPSSAEITTTNGYFKTPVICPIELNKTYHAALVYDGTTLKFYRNGFLMSQTPATGNLFQNDWQTQIGKYENGLFQTNFIGYTTEVRIWNVARTQSQIRTYMNQSLPNPSTITGLLAYYRFDNLLNKQGNTQWNGALGGSATINQVNPNCSPVSDSCGLQNQTATASFLAPDTVCLGTPVNITNNSTGATTYNWNFCTANVNTSPTGSNLGNIGNQLTTPCFIDYAYENGNYYGFVTNNNPAALVRLNFGNSLLNAPTATNLGNFGNALPLGAQGIQLVQEGGRWYAFITGGDVQASSSATSRILKFDFGTSLVNTPTVTNWGNIGNLNYPHDLYMFKDAGNWYGFTVNLTDGTVTRFNFGANFNSAPVGTNLGNLGSLNQPSGICPVNDNGTWRIFVANFGNGTLSRIDFGNSLLNTPTGSQNLGSLGGVLNTTRDLYIFKYCGESVGFAVNDNRGDMVRLNFSNLTATPTATSLGNFAGMANPHSISKMFRVGADLYSFVPNPYVNTMSRIVFPGCTNASIPNSTAQNPPPIAYTTPGVYNVSLTVDEGLISQAVYCKKVVVLPIPPKSPTQNITVCAGGSVKIGSSVTPATYLWNTGATTDSITVTTSGIYWVESSHLGCSVRDSFVVQLGIGSPLEFGFQQDICNPLRIQFFTTLPINTQNFQWNFGNGQTNNLDVNPQVTYAVAGTYTVKLVTQSSGGCKDSVERNIAITLPFDAQLILNADTTICRGDSILLRSPYAIGAYCWNVFTGTIPGDLYSIIRPDTTTTYRVTSEVLGSNLIVNGNFSAGNTSFTSDYQSAFPNLLEGQYWVGASPSSWNGGMSNCGDRTTGSGSMLCVNGSPQANAKVWSQTVNVTPNTTYRFSAWVTSLYPSNPCNLRFSINNTSMGGTISGASPCQWNQYATSWNSGNNTTATITLVNNNTIADGNDFGIDDIFFGPVVLKTDSLRVTVRGMCDSIDINGLVKVCSATDTLSYAVFRSEKCALPYSLIVDNNFVDVVGQSATSVRLRFKQPGSTVLKVAYANECKTVVDSLKVDIRFSPPAINLGPDLAICRDTVLTLNAGPGFETYLWQNGITTPAISFTAGGMYHVTATDFCGTAFRDTFLFNKQKPTPFAYSPISLRQCGPDSVLFAASGGDLYTWSPAAGFENPLAPSSLAWIDRSLAITLHVNDTACRRDTLITIPVVYNSPPVLTLNKSNDVNCVLDSAVISASGGLRYSWLPTAAITRQTNNSITVRPQQSTTYIVTATDAQGCTAEDSISVVFTPLGDQQLWVPNAFTPNNDGLNDVIRPRITGRAGKYEFRVYNRWGGLLFLSNNPMQGWDGTHKGEKQPLGTYVYLVTAEGSCNGKFTYKGTFTLIR